MNTERFDKAGTSLDFLLGFSILIATWAFSIVWIHNLTGSSNVFSCTATLTGLQALSMLTDSPGVPSNWEETGYEKVYGLHDSQKPGNVLDPVKIDSYFNSTESGKKSLSQQTSKNRVNISIRASGETNVRSTGPPAPDDFLITRRIVSVPSPGCGFVDVSKFLDDSGSPNFKINLTPVGKEKSPILKPFDTVTLCGMELAKNSLDNPVRVLNISYCQSGICNSVKAITGGNVFQENVPFPADDCITLSIPDSYQIEKGEFRLNFAEGTSRIQGTANIEEYMEYPAIISMVMW